MNNIRPTNRDGERGVALVMALLLLALMLALGMGISLTAISEMGVSNTYANQTQAFQAAEAGLYHGLNLVRNFTNEGAGGDPNFTKLLALRGTISPTPYSGNNPFTDPTLFASGSVMIINDGDGHQLRDAAGNLVPGATYSVHIIDDEKTTSTFVGPKVPNFIPPATPIWEDNDPATDKNNRVVLYSIGKYANTSVTLEGWVGFVPYPALVAQKDVSVGGNSIINGAYGGVHSNGDLTVGASAYIEQTATATGTYTQNGGGADVQGFHGGGQPALYIPKFVTNAPLPSGGPNTTPRIQDYIIRKADTLLIDPDYASTDRPGETAHQRVNNLEARLNVTTDSLWNALTTGAANPHQEQAVTIARVNGVGSPSLVSNVSDTGWRYNGGNGWDIVGPTIDNHTFYLVGMDNYNLGSPSASTPNGGNATITTNLGSDGTPIHISVFATGSIEITGTPDFVSNATGITTTELPPFVTVSLMFVTVEDVKIRGNAGVPRFSGIIFAGEQFDLSGNGAFDGQVISLSNNDVSHSLVSTNSVSGSFELTFNGGQAVGNIKLMSWRQIKQ